MKIHTCPECDEAPDDLPENILSTAIRLTSSDRQSTYGHPADHFARTVALLNILWADKLKTPLTSEDWPLAMLADKLARLLGPKWNLDNLVDIAGYARTLQMVKEREPKPPASSTS